MENKTSCIFLDNNAKNVVDFFESLGYDWMDYLQAHGPISKAWFTLKQGDGRLVILEYGDYIIFDFELKQFSKLSPKEYKNINL